MGNLLLSVVWHIWGILGYIITGDVAAGLICVAVGQLWLAVEEIKK